MNPAEKLRVLHDKLKRGERLSKAEQRFVDKAERPAEYYPTLEAAAEHYGVVRSALDRWKEGYPEGFVKTAQGYEAKGIAEARRRFLGSGKLARLNKGDQADSESQDGEESAILPSLDYLKRKKTDLDCQKTAQQIDLLRRLSVSRAEATRGVRVFFHGLGDSVMRVGGEICYAVSGVTPAEAKEIIDNAIREKLNKANEIDFARFEALLDGDGAGISNSMRLPAARETNGRKPAPK